MDASVRTLVNEDVGEDRDMAIEDTGKEQRAEKAYSLAYEYEQRFHNCPQCVFAALQEVLGVGDDATFKAAHTLGGGGARSTAGTCGALGGGMLAIGSIWGRDRQHFDVGSHEDSARIGKRLFDRFVEEFGSPICGDVHIKLMGRRYDIWTEMEQFENAGAHTDKCPSVTGRTAKWAAEIILEEQTKANRQ